MLGSGAVLGRVFAFELLRELEQISGSTCSTSSRRRERSGVIVPASPGEPRTNVDVRPRADPPDRARQISASAPPTTARPRGRGAGTASTPRALEPHAAKIAHHLIEAGPAADPKRTFRYLLMAGTFAQDSAAFEEALATWSKPVPGCTHRRPPSARSCCSRWAPRDVANGSGWEPLTRGGEAASAPARRPGHADGPADPQRGLVQPRWSARWEEAWRSPPRALDMLGGAPTGAGAVAGPQAHGVGLRRRRAVRVSDSLAAQALADRGPLGGPGAAGVVPALPHHDADGVAAGRGGRRRRTGGGRSAAGRRQPLGGGPPPSASRSVPGCGGRLRRAAPGQRALEPLAERLGDFPALLQAAGRLPPSAFAATGDLDLAGGLGPALISAFAQGWPPSVSKSRALLGLSASCSAMGRGPARSGIAAAPEPPGVVRGWGRSLLLGAPRLCRWDPCNCPGHWMAPPTTGDADLPRPPNQ